MRDTIRVPTHQREALVDITGAVERTVRDCCEFDGPRRERHIICTVLEA